VINEVVILQGLLFDPMRVSKAVAAAMLPFSKHDAANLNASFYIQPRVFFWIVATLKFLGVRKNSIAVNALKPVLLKLFIN